MLRIIWWVVVAGIVTAGGYAVVSERKSVFVEDDGKPARFGALFGGGKVAGESAEAAKAIADSAAKSFVPQVVRDFLADPGAAIKGQVAGAQQSAIEAVKNEIADLFNIATATLPSAASGSGAEGGTPCVL